jgi:Peptidase M50B-like
MIDSIIDILKNQNTWWFIAALLLASIVGRIKIIGPYLRIINTMFHEFGHALFALFFKGKVIDMELFSDTSGTTLTQSKSKRGQFMVAIAGYPFSLVVSIVLYYLVIHEKYDIILWTISITAAICLVLWVRNAFGVFWLLLIIAISLGACYYQNESIKYYLCLVFFLLQMSDAFLSTFILFFISIKKPQRAGDAMNLQRITGIPAFFWALLFVACALGCLFVLLKIHLWVGIIFSI